MKKISLSRSKTKHNPQFCSFALTSLLFFLSFVTKAQTYCTPSYGSGTGSGDYISLVDFVSTSLNSSSGGAIAPYYTFFQNSGSTTATLSIGVPYSVNVAGGSYSTCYISVWGDWNQDGNFDATEFMGVSPNAGATTTVNLLANFTIPNYALSGVTRIRFRSSDTAPGPLASESCGNTNSAYGETEDYEIYLMPLPPCSGLPVSGDATSTNTLICANSSFYLSLLNSSVSSGLQYQWQSSPNGVTWANLGSLQPSYLLSVTALTANTYYQCITTCSASTLSSTSTPIFVTLNPLLNCYCLPTYSLDCTGDKISDFSLANVVVQSSNCAANGYSDSTLSTITAINLTAGNTYTLQANIANSGNGGNMAAGAWIDYNQNGIFDATEFTYLGNGGSQFYSNTLIVPVNSLSGSVRMRIKVDAYFSTPTTILDPCNNNNFSSYGQIVDYKVNITAATPCSGAPNAGGVIATDSSVCVNETFTLDIVGNSISTNINYQWQSSTDNATWTNIGVVQSTIPFSILTQNVTSYYRCISTCTTSAPISSTSTPVTITQNLPTACYCTPENIYCTNAQITNVLFETLNDSPLCGASGYTDNTSTIASVSLTANQTYSITNTINTQIGIGYIVCWIDYNQNGIFESSEFNNLGNTTSSSTLTSNITVPFTAVGGNTRMRIKLASSYNAISNIDPCLTNGVDGQILDYAIYVTPVTSCAGNPIAGDATSTFTSICESTPFTLDLINNGIVSNISYQWQSSTDNVSWTNIGSSQTNVPYTIISQSVTSYYRCLTTCTTSALTSTSTVWTVTQNLPTTCYCIPDPTDCAGSYFIKQVSFATMTNTSSCGANGYTDYTASVPSATTTAGQTYTLTTVLGYYNSGDVYAWIDYDKNGVFDSAEYTYLGTSSASDTIAGTITIPVTAIPGITRMRVRNILGNSTGPSDACNTPTLSGRSGLNSTMGAGLTSGETEDYFVTILPPDCSQINIPASVSVLGAIDICIGSSTNLDLSTSLPTSIGLTYQWKYFNGSVYVNLGSPSASSSYTDSPIVNTPYYCEILCNGTPILNSDTILVKVHSITATPTSTNVTCNGICDGAIALNAVTTGPILTYDWILIGNTTDMVSGLCAGNYLATISNSVGCIITQTINISEPTLIVAPITTNSVSCYGLTNGNLSTTISGGTGTLSITWTPGNINTATASNLSAGNYSLQIVDENGCSLNQQVTISQPSQLLVNVSNIVGTCFGGSAGQAEMLVSGGVPSYNYNWTSGGANQLETGLSIGTETCTITDANLCTITETVSIAQVAANFSLSISGASTICEQLEDSIISTISAGSGSFSYSWIVLPTNVTSVKPNFTYTSSIGSYSYNLTVTDNVSNCIVNSSTLTLQVNSSSNFSGIVTTNTTIPVAGRVILYKYLPFYTKFDSVAGQTIGVSGNFLFNSFTAGTYIIKAIPTASNLQIAYGDSAVNWKTAKQIIHGCAVNDIQNIEVKALSVFTTTGTGSLSGQITEGQGFGQRMGNGLKPTVPGNPIGGIIVKGGKNPGGQMFVQTTTDTLGNYMLSGLPINTGNESYFILVDIPGLDTNNTYHEVISLTNNQYTNLDFVVDSAKVNPIHITDVSVQTISAIKNQIKVFPNPATNKVTVIYSLANNSIVKIELCDVLGKTIKSILPLTEQSLSEYFYTVPLNDFTSGLYFMKIKINNAENVIKLVITE